MELRSTFFRLFLLSLLCAVCNSQAAAYEYTLLGTGWCKSSYTYLPEAAYPPVLDDSEPLYDADRIRECMNRCLAAYESGVAEIGNEGFWVTSNENCGCSDGACLPSGHSGYTSYSISQIQTNTQDHHYYTKPNGYCTDNGDAYVSSISECSHGFAFATGISQTANWDDHENSDSVTYDPQGCYYEGGELKFGGTNNSGPCSSSDTCICRRAISSPTFSPTDLPTPTTGMGWSQDWRCVIRSRELDPVSSVSDYSFPDESRASECLFACQRTGLECCRIDYSLTPAQCYAGIFNRTKTAEESYHWAYSLGDPTFHPSVCPTFFPSVIPTLSPTVTPTISPSTDPTFHPSVCPTLFPSVSPSVYPTFFPSVTPTLSPTVTPTIYPSTDPSFHPSVCPTLFPSFIQSVCPTFFQSVTPTLSPTSPSVTPTISPSTGMLRTTPDG